MAYIGTFTCITCHNEVQEAVPTGRSYSECYRCRTREETERRTAHLDHLRTLPMGERLAKIEAWIYDSGAYK